MQNDVHKQLGTIGFLLFSLLAIYGQQGWVPGFFPDAYIYTGVSASVADGHWLVPTFDPGRFPVFHMHPPLIFMIQGFFYQFLDPQNWSHVRLVGLIWVLITFLLLYFSVRKWGNQRWAFWSGMVFILMPHLMKISRSPCLDIPLTLFILASLVAYYHAIRTDKLLVWLLSGLFFGMALLTKGPPALVVPLTIAIHLIAIGKWQKLLDWKPWCGLFAGFVIFSLWPLALYLTNRFDVFQQYWNAQVVEIVLNDRAETKFTTHVYLWHLIKTSLPWLILAGWSIYKIVKRRKESPFALLFVIAFLTVLLPYSFVKFKLSHYIIPLYPAYAALAGWGIAEFSTKLQDRLQLVMKVLVSAAILALLILPLTTKVRRDSSLIKTVEIIRQLPAMPTHWGSIDGTYGSQNLVNYLGWQLKKDINFQGINDIEGKIVSTLSDEKWVYFVTPNHVAHLRKKFSKRFLDRYRILLYFKKDNFAVLVDSRLMQHENSGEAIFSY